MNTPVNAASVDALTPAWSPADIHDALIDTGWILLRGQPCNLDLFSALIHALSETLTFDPARDYAADAVQKVDAGIEAVGLHIENGNTPLPPDIVSFYSAKSARQGSQTTVCDGVAMLRDIPEALRRRFAQPFTMTRYLPQLIWQRYVATAMKVADPERVDRMALTAFIDAVPGQSFVDAEAGGIDYTLTIDAIRADNRAGVPAFANALLGPSYNYQAPRYRFANGDDIDQSTLEELRSIGERHTQEVAWQDGDVVVIDNKRVMHGRRQIEGPLSDRKLYIAMGIGVRDPAPVSWEKV